MIKHPFILLRVLAVLALMASCPLLAADSTQEPIIQTDVFRPDLAFGTVNCFPATTREQALQRREDLKALDRRVTVEEFLGAEIERIFVFPASEPTFFENPEEEIRTWLHSIVWTPDGLGQPEVHVHWAEGVDLFLEGFIRYEDGCTGSFRVGQSHFVAEDADGVHWFHRWDAFFPKRQGVPPEDPSPDP